MRKLFSEFTSNFRIAYPIVLGQLSHVLISLVDNIMVGKLGVNSLGAVSLANSVFFMIFTLGLGISMAITPLVATAEGKNNKKQSVLVFEHGFVLNVIMGLLMAGFTICITPIVYLKQPEEVVKLSIPFLYIIGFSFIPFMIFQSLKQFSAGLSLTKPTMFSEYLALGINIFLNYCFIFGKFGFSEMGVQGVGYATLISRVFMLLILFFILIKNKQIKLFIPLIKFKVFKKKIFLKIFELGVPNSLQMLFEVGAFAMSSFISGLISAKALAAHQIATNIASISFLVVTGLGIATTIRVANQKGLKNFQMARTISFSFLLMVFMIMCFCAGIFWGLNDILPLIYTDDIEVVMITASLLIVVALFQISDGIQVVSLSALRGLQDVKVPTWVSFIAYWGIAMPISYLLAITFEVGVIGVWAGLGIGLTISAIFITIRLNKLSKKYI